MKVGSKKPLILVVKVPPVTIAPGRKTHYGSINSIASAASIKIRTGD